MEALSAPRPHGVRIPTPRRLLAALSDERLVAHVRNGDAAAFEVLYDRYSAGLLGFCQHMLRSAADAEDALQHTFIAAHADIQRAGDRQLHVKAWLYTIARNRCLSMLRARREQVADEPIEIVADNFVQDVQQREDLRAMLDDVSKLPDDQREALVLSELGGLSHEDISQVIGCEASKVKSLVFQARTALIDRRTARDMSCEEIREQLATLRGGALRRSHLRHHLEACPGCTQYREEVRRQRAMLALALPVVPSAALKSHVLGSLGLGGSSAAVAATTGAAAVGAAGAGSSSAGLGFAGAGIAKLGVAAALVVGGAGTAAVAQNGGLPVFQHNAPGAQTSTARDQGAAGSKASGASPVSNGGKTTATHSGSQRSASGSKHGFTPTTGGSNGARARQFAQTRGRGKHTGLTKTHTNHATTRPSTQTPTRAHGAPRSHVNPAPRAHTKAKVPAGTLKRQAPRSATPAPKATAPSSSQPAPTQSVPETTITPAPGARSGAGGGTGQALGVGKRAADAVTG